MNTIRKQAGFTLIELMIVIAILAILIAIAVPAYQNYTIRAKVSECVNATAPAKVAVSETRLATGSFPGNNTQAGWEGFTSDYCTSIDVGANGVITMTADPAGVGAPGAVTATWTPTTITGSQNIQWDCDASAGNQYLPAECR